MLKESTVTEFCQLPEVGVGFFIHLRDTVKQKQ
jgi:hypothetical protein